MTISYKGPDRKGNTYAANALFSTGALNEMETLIAKGALSRWRALNPIYVTVLQKNHAEQHDY